MKIGIVGNGFVGGATSLLEADGIKVVIYDKDSSKCSPDSSVTPADLFDCDFVFICVPTPMRKDGSCHTPIVEGCVYELNMAGIKSENIIVRSTVPVGFCDSLGVNFMPEFLTESSWENDFRNHDSWIFGLHEEDSTITKSKVVQLLTLAKVSGNIKSNSIFFCSSKEAELTKLTRNAFLATKVSFFNEINNFCDTESIDFDTVAELVTLDDRIGTSHTQVPGPDGKNGFGGTCLPKDISSLNHQILKSGMESYVIEAANSRNIQVDRTEQDWLLENDKGFDGRTII